MSYKQKASYNINNNPNGDINKIKKLNNHNSYVNQQEIL